MERVRLTDCGLQDTREERVDEGGEGDRKDERREIGRSAVEYILDANYVLG